MVYASRPDRMVANCALGPTRDHAWLAEGFAQRSSWPSVHSGFRFDDVSSYSEVIFDDQSFFDLRDGGGYLREAVSVRSGVLVR
jgi:hypothetical protein